MFRIGKKNQLQELITQAQTTPLLRKNLNFHQESDQIQRFFNALIPGTYVCPHRHQHPLKTETMILIQGNMVVVIFDDDGNIKNKIELSNKSPNIALDIDPDVWHSVYALEPTVYFECKLGPYNPITAKDFAHWAPSEDSPNVQAYLKHMIET